MAIDCHCMHEYFFLLKMNDVNNTNHLKTMTCLLIIKKRCGLKKKKDNNQLVNHDMEDELYLVQV